MTISSKRGDIPEWSSYDLPLEQLKAIIYQHTSFSATIPLPIPVSKSHRWDALDTELFSRLDARYQLQCLFLRSRGFELKSRLASLEATLSQLRLGYQTIPRGRSHLSSKRCARLGRKAQDIRYILRNLVAFRSNTKSAYEEVIREYSKYTNGSGSLQEMMQRECWKQSKFDVDYTNLSDRLERAQKLIDTETAAATETARYHEGENGRPYSAGVAEEGRPWTRASSTTTLEGYQSVGKMSVTSSPTIDAGYWSDPDRLSDVEDIGSSYLCEEKEEVGCLSSCFSSLSKAFSGMFGWWEKPTAISSNNRPYENTRLLA